MELSQDLAAILGPLLMAITLSEYLHYDIWKKVDPTVVSLNGLVLLSGGLVLLRLHNRWQLDWPLLITLLSWALLAAGLLRLFFPKAKQLPQSRGTYLFLILLFSIGGFLTFKGYF